MIMRLAKPLIAAIFISAGIDAFRDLHSRVNEVQPFVEKTVAKLGDAAPEETASDLTTTVVKVDAAVKIGAGLALAFDKAPRLAAFLLAVGLIPDSLATHAFWEHESATMAHYQRTLFLRDAGLLGGLLLVISERREKRGA